MKTIFCFILLLFPVFLFAQCTDSLVQPNPYAHCIPDYDPVCACDGKTYRNYCAAEQWGAILPGNYVDGPCSDFDIDFSPNPVQGAPSSLYIYMKHSGSVSLQIYSAFGRLILEQTFSNSSNTPGKISEANPYYLNMRDFQKGIYILLVSLGGDKKTRKIIRLAQ